MTWLGSKLLALGCRRSSSRLERATQDPVATQEAKLREIMQRNASTEYGLEHGFAKVSSLRDYAEQVPVATFEDLRDYIDRMLQGESNVLVAEDPVMYARTSGTTGDPKHIPVTPTCRGREHSDQMRTWFYHAQCDHPGIFRGKTLSLVSPAVEGHSPAGIPYGSTSGHIYKNLPWYVRSSYAIPYDVFEIEDYEAKYYAIMRIGLTQNVTFLCTANPSSIVKLCEIADDYAEELIRDIRDGTLRGDLYLSKEIRARIERGLRPNAARAKALERMRSRRDGRLLPADYWPNLELIGCWKGGTVGVYLESFPDWFATSDRESPPVRDWGYLSSEGRCSIPLQDDGSAGVLTVGTNVYEFVHASELEDAPDDASAWKFLRVDELEKGEQYYVFLTTTGGLYRYDINDVIEVEGFYNATPTIVFRRKGRGMTNLTGEKLSVNQVLDSIDKATKEMDLSVTHYRAEADPKESRYVFRVELPDRLGEERAVALLESIERGLAECNIEYSAKRKSLRLRPPALEIMREGWYDSEKRDLLDARRLFQSKTVRLAARSEEDEDQGASFVVERYELTDA